MAIALEFVSNAVLGLLGILFRWLIFFPVIWLISLPFILVLATFSKRTYSCAVTGMFGVVSRIWSEWGLDLVW